MSECGTAFGTGALFIIVEKWEWPSIHRVNGQKNLHKGQWNGPAIKTHSLQALGPQFDSKTHGTRRELAPGSCPLISTHALWPMVNPHLSLSPSPSLLSSSSPSCSFSLLPALIHIQTLTCKIIFFKEREQWYIYKMEQNSAMDPWKQRLPVILNSSVGCEWRALDGAAVYWSHITTDVMCNSASKSRPIQGVARAVPCNSEA